MNVVTFTHILEFDRDIVADTWKHNITWQLAIKSLKENEETKTLFNCKNEWWREFFEFIDDNGFNVEYTQLRDEVYSVKIEPKNLQR